MDNASWNILDALLGERPVEVITATAQGQVIGKRHFGKKAQPPGRRRRARRRARAVRHAAPVEGPRGARRAGARRGRRAAERCADRLSHRRGRACRCGALRSRRGDGAHDAGPDALLGPAAGGARAGRIQRDVHAAQHDRPAGDAQSSRGRCATGRPTTAKGKTLANGQQSVALAASEAKLVSVPVKVPVDVERLYWEVTARPARRRSRPAARRPEGDRGASGARLPGDARAARQARSSSRSSGRPARCPAAAASASR